MVSGVERSQVSRTGPQSTTPSAMWWPWCCGILSAWPWGTSWPPASCSRCGIFCGGRWKVGGDYLTTQHHGIFHGKHGSYPRNMGLIHFWSLFSPPKIALNWGLLATRHPYHFTVFDLWPKLDGLVHVLYIYINMLWWSSDTRDASWLWNSSGSCCVRCICCNCLLHLG